MNFQDAVKTCLQKYATLTGRASRPEYWWFVLAQVVLYLVLGMVSDVLTGIAYLALLVPSIAVGVRRLHDIGKSGWLLLVGLIPFVGWLVVLYWMVQPSVAGSNEYGDAPAAGLPVDVAPGAQ